MATPHQAKITSTEALEGLRSAMVIFVMKARRALDDTSHAARLTRQWVQFDQRTHWMGEVKRRHKKLERAQQELMSAKLASNANTAMANRERAVLKAQHEIAEAEAKLKKIKAWSQNFDSAADPAIKRVDRLQHTLMEYQKAIAYLVAIQKALAAYAQRKVEFGDSTISIADMSKELGVDINAVAEAAAEVEIPLDTTQESEKPENEARPSISVEALNKELGIDINAETKAAPRSAAQFDTTQKTNPKLEGEETSSLSLDALSKELGVDMTTETPAPTVANPPPTEPPSKI